jgi:hypothetical protein
MLLLRVEVLHTDVQLRVKARVVLPVDREEAQGQRTEIVFLKWYSKPLK